MRQGKPTGPALAAVEPEHDRWAVLVNGYVTYAGPEAECRKRLDILTAPDPGRDRQDQFLQRAIGR